MVATGLDELLDNNQLKLTCFLPTDKVQDYPHTHTQPTNMSCSPKNLSEGMMGRIKWLNMFCSAGI